MLKIVICDDEEIIVNYVEKLIRESIKENMLVYKYTDGKKLKEDNKKEKLKDINILFIDIKINENNGIEIAKIMQKENQDLKIIYMTAYSQYSEEIFQTTPTYLLLKPLKKDKFKEAITKALKESKKGEGIKTFSVKGKIFNIKVNNIKYIESNKRVAIIHENDLIRKIYAKLNELEEILPKQFIRCHQSYIINLDKVSELSSHEFVLSTGERVPISQLKYKETKDLFIQYLGEVI